MPPHTVASAATDFSKKGDFMAMQPAPKSFTALIYFHGMGSQRRYEESARLIDVIDRFLGSAYRSGGEELGRLTDIDPRIEPHATTQGKTVTYVRTRHLFKDAQGATQSNDVRVYESYWAPSMVAEPSAMAVVKWIFRQALRPVIGRAASWREFHRLRRSALVELQEDFFMSGAGGPTDEYRGDHEKLLRVYAEFDGLAAKRTYPRGDFHDFVRFVGDEYANRPETARRLKLLAWDWHDRFRANERRNLILIWSLALALLLLAGFAVLSILALLSRIPAALTALGVNADLVAGFAEKYPASILGAVGVFGTVVIGWLFGGFLTSYLGDVQTWATFSETSEKFEKRRAVIDQGVDLFKHVLSLKGCTRVVVVGHSLGTSVATDTLMALRRNNLAEGRENPMAKPVDLRPIRHFVTIASPVDKINYFFESYRTASHRYSRVIEALRGDLGEVPFTNNRHPHIHWVNFWDEADVISGPLHSPVGRQSLANFVDNVHVRNLTFPSPGRAHTAYFENRKVVSELFRIIYRNEYSFEDMLPGMDRQGIDYRDKAVGPGADRGAYGIYFAGAVALPWLALFVAAAYIFGAMKLMTFFGIVFAGVLAFLLIAWATSGSDNRDPI
jgi:pimeloyl-ACP methyl ester carboxylesterase